jgi:hypothetical protein
MKTNPDRSECSTSLLATITDISSSALWMRLRPWKRIAKARALATSSAVASREAFRRVGHQAAQPSGEKGKNHSRNAHPMRSLLAVVTYRTRAIRKMAGGTNKRAARERPLLSRSGLRDGG